MLKINSFCILFNILFLCSIVNAQEVNIIDSTNCIIIDSIGRFELEGAIQIFKEEERSYSIEEVTHKNTDFIFQPLNSYSSPLEEDATYWGRVLLNNNLNDDLLEARLWLTAKDFSKATIYISEINDIDFVKTELGRLGPIGNNQINSSNIWLLYFGYVDIDIRSNQTKIIYIRLENKADGLVPNFNITFQPLTAPLISKIMNTYFLVGIIWGILFIVGGYSFILFCTLRDKNYLIYSLFVFFNFVFVYYGFGIKRELITDYLCPNGIDYFINLRSVKYLILICYLAFIKSFLNIKGHLPKWDNIFNIIICIGGVFFFVENLILIYTNHNIYYTHFLMKLFAIIFTICLLFFIYPLWLLPTKKKIFIIASIIFFVLHMLINPFSIDKTKINLSIIFSFSLGVLIEIIIFGLGLSYRQKENQFQLLLSKEKSIQLQREQELNQFKANFYTNITHEFRTPLTVIMGMTSNIKGYQKETKLIQRNSNHLLQLINQLLDLSKIESASLQLHTIQGDIIKYLQYLTESFSSMATDKQIQLTFYSEENELLMNYDEVKMQHIIYNLLSNAIKFTPKGGKVILHLQTVLQENNSFLKIRVKDTGIGITTNKIPHIFKRFYQVDNSSSRKSEGTGIGLTLVYELIQLMKGKITVESQEGKGTSFLIWLPIENKAIIGKQEWNKKEEMPNSLLLEEEKLVYPSTLLNAPILLVIEDNKDVITYINSLLKDQYTIHTANNGEEGIEQAISLIPDLIISDIMMPIKDGYEVCDFLKQDERTSHIPIILLTAKASQNDKIEGLKIGADVFITKPFQRKELLIQITNLLNVRKQLHKRYAELPLRDKNREKTTNIEEDFLNKLQNLIDKNIEDTNFGVSELATAINMSNTQLYRKLKTLTQKTPSQFIRSIRLQRARDLLKNAALNISEIAYLVGFSDPNYFSRVFQQEFGHSPRDFRKKL